MKRKFGNKITKRFDMTINKVSESNRTPPNLVDKSGATLIVNLLAVLLVTMSAAVMFLNYSQNSAIQFHSDNDIELNRIKARVAETLSCEYTNGLNANDCGDDKVTRLMGLNESNQPVYLTGELERTGKLQGAGYAENDWYLRAKCTGKKIMISAAKYGEGDFYLHPVKKTPLDFKADFNPILEFASSRCAAKILPPSGDSYNNIFLSAHHEPTVYRNLDQQNATRLTYDFTAKGDHLNLNIEAAMQGIGENLESEVYVNLKKNGSYILKNHHVLRGNLTDKYMSFSHTGLFDQEIERGQNYSVELNFKLTDTSTGGSFAGHYDDDGNLDDFYMDDGPYYVTHREFIK